MAYLVPRKTERALILLQVENVTRLVGAEHMYCKGGPNLHREVPCFFGHLMDFAGGLGSACTSIVDYTNSIVVPRSAYSLLASYFS